MASYNNETRKCPKCGTLVGIKISYGIYPARSLETAYCPVCGYELFHKNITNLRRADVSSVMMNYQNGTISSKALSRRISAEVIF